MGNEVFGGEAEVVVEGGGEVGVGGEADSVGHFADVGSVADEQSGGLLESEGLDEDVGGNAVAFFHLAVEVDTADAHFVGKLLDGELAVVEVLLDGFADAAKEFVVGVLHDGHGHFVVEGGTTGLVAHFLPYLQHLADGRTEHDDVDRLFEVVVGLNVEAL